MTWVRDDDQAPLHRKIAPLSDAAYRFHNEAKCWASRNGTDGRIAADEVAAISLSSTVNRSLLRLIDELVRRRLFHRAEDTPCPHSYGQEPTCAEPGPDGWVIHDYLEYNPSAVEVRQGRKAKAERQKRWRDSRRGSGASRNASPVVPGDVPGDVPKDAAPRASVAPTPPRPAPKEGGDGVPAVPAAAVGGRAAGGGQAQDRAVTHPPPSNGPASAQARAEIRAALAATKSARTAVRRAGDALAELRALTPDVPALVEPEPPAAAAEVWS